MTEVYESLDEVVDALASVEMFLKDNPNVGSDEIFRKLVSIRRELELS